MMVRSDGGREATTYYRGGKTLPKDQAIEEAVSLSLSGRAVIFVEPTNRFQNLFCINILINYDGSWRGEALGPGFDTSDLQRGFVTPKWLLSGPELSHTVSEPLRASEIEIQVNEQQTDEDRLTARLRSINDLLNLGGDSVQEQTCRARKFLQKSDCLRLFDQKQIFDIRSAVRTINDCSQIYVNFRSSRKFFPMTTAAAVVWDRRFVYWDITFGPMKWFREN